MPNRNLTIAAFFFGIVFSTCTSEPIVIAHELNGVYEGTAMSWYKSSNSFFDQSYSEHIRVEITYPSFTKTQIDKESGCTGKVLQDGSVLDFDGGDCGCWCDCNLLDYCAGDIILGEVRYEWKGDSLIMFHESEHTGRKYKKRIALVRK
jgi:hypothetical protein